MYTNNHVFSQFFILFSLSENIKIHVEFQQNDDDTILRNNFHEFLNVPISGHYKIKQSKKKGFVVLFYECILYIDIKNKYIYNICQMALPLKKEKTKRRDIVVRNVTCFIHTFLLGSFCTETYYTFGNSKKYKFIYIGFVVTCNLCVQTLLPFY